MKRLVAPLVLGVAAWLSAGGASATVIVDHITTVFIPGNPNELFTVQVRVKWDGQGALQGVFSSTRFDPELVEFVSATTAPASIFGFTDVSDPEHPVVIPGLTRRTTLLQQPDDPPGLLRTVQYGAIEPVDGRGLPGPGGRLITTLTFRMIGLGSANIYASIANGDTGAIGDGFQVGRVVTVVVIPEPGSALLIGLGLAGLGVDGQRRVARS